MRTRTAEGEVWRRCPICLLVGHGELCMYHFILVPDWAAGNRAFCDFVHRGKVGKAEPMTDENWTDWLNTERERGAIVL